MSAKTSTRCPICGKETVLGAENFPFCSERCRTIDLGNWASEKYVISSPAADAVDIKVDIKKDADED